MILLILCIEISPNTRERLKETIAVEYATDDDDNNGDGDDPKKM